MTNNADPDQLASLEANWSGSTLFAKTGHVIFSKRRVYFSKKACCGVIIRSTSEKWETINTFWLTHLSLAFHNIWSGSTLFALNTGISIKYGYNKNYPDTPSIENELVKRFKVEDSTRHKWVKKMPICSYGICMWRWWVGKRDERETLKHCDTSTSFIIVPSNILVSCIQLKQEKY